jgi:hypothetical protein
VTASPWLESLEPSPDVRHTSGTPLGDVTRLRWREPLILAMKDGLADAGTLKPPEAGTQAQLLT